MKMLAVRVLMTLAYAQLVVFAAPVYFLGTEGAVIAVFPAIVLGFVAAQSHRGISYSRILTAASIPLQTKLHEITLNHLTPTVHHSS
jgi:hypothetical protein